MLTTKGGMPPGDEIVQEIRFAVVMYGGVSLAIYINGVVQELRRLVAATAGSGGGNALPQGKLESTATVYPRGLAQRLPGAGSVMSANAPIRTRFVVDILSGTSAGGINAIFLAKALVMDRPVTALKDLWIREGDLGRLLNDAAGAARPRRRRRHC